MKAPDPDKKDEKVLIPLNGRILFMKDEDKSETKSGIILPDNVKIPVLTGRVVEISEDVVNNPDYKYLKKYDKVVVNYSNYTPVSCEPDNKLFFMPITSVIGVYKNKDELDE